LLVFLPSYIRFDLEMLTSLPSHARLFTSADMIYISLLITE
jgi:hypothetical protein